MSSKSRMGSKSSSNGRKCSNKSHKSSKGQEDTHRTSLVQASPFPLLMAGQAPHDILVYQKTVWLSVSAYNWVTGLQRWRVYKRLRNQTWWAGGLILKVDAPIDLDCASS